MKKLSLLFLSSLLLAGCAGGNRAGIAFDPSVPADQRTLMEHDLSFLSSIEMPAPTSSNDLTNIGIGDFSPNSLLYFLSQRIKFIVGQEFDYTSQLYASTRPDGEPTVLVASQMTPFAATSTQVVMDNLGASLYLTSKDTSYLLYLNLEAAPNLAIRSPRVGIIRVGAGFTDANAIKNVPLEAVSNTLLRISTYFHEARHSDSNKASVAFPHASCTSGTYEGKYACEKYINGPYGIQNILMKYFYSVCQSKGCSSTEMAGLLIKIADFKTRMIGTAYGDPRPESIP